MHFSALQVCEVTRHFCPGAEPQYQQRLPENTGGIARRSRKDGLLQWARAAGRRIFEVGWGAFAILHIPRKSLKLHIYAIRYPAPSEAGGPHGVWIGDGAALRYAEVELNFILNSDIKYRMGCDMEDGAV
jgi:hypothetical protein